MRNLTAPSKPLPKLLVILAANRRHFILQFQQDQIK